MSPFAHASIGLMARPAARSAPLWVLLLATQMPDILFFAFEVAGLEHQAVTEVTMSQGLSYISPASMFWSHGLLMNLIWSAIFAAIATLFWRDRRASLIIGLLVFSHWALDFIVYSNLPLFLVDKPMVGLGLITSGPGFILGIILELLMIGGGIAFTIVCRRRDKNKLVLG